MIAIGWFGVSIVGGFIDGWNGDDSSSESSSSIDDFSFNSLTTDYTLTRDAAHHADLAVTETFDTQFSDYDLNHGILRAIPRTADGRSLHLKVRSVTDADGTPIQYQSDNGGGFTVLKIGDPYEYVTGRQTYVIRYTMRDVIQQQAFGGAQRFNFDVNGTGWDVMFDKVTATLHVPADLAGALNGDDACYQGKQGATTVCAHNGDGSTFTASASNLGPHENVTMIVGFTGGTFAVPISIPRLIVWIVLGLAVVVLALAIIVRFRSLGNPKGTGIIVPQYEAFPGIGVMEAAELLDQRDRAFPALVTELVTSRAATMTRDDEGTEKTDDDVYTLKLLDGRVLDDDDSTAVATLFGSLKHGKTVSLRRDNAKVGDAVSKLLRDAHRSVRKQGLIARRHTRFSTSLLIAGLALVVVGIALLAGLHFVGLSSWVHNVALVISIAFGVATVVFVWPRERLTESALPAYEHLLGIRDYLRLAEADRIKMLQSPSGAETTPIVSADGTPNGEQLVKLYEKLLPYAILFDIEKEWREVLGGYWATTPTEVTPTLQPMGTFLLANAFASSNYATTASTSTSTSSGSHSWSSSGGSSSFSSGGGGFSGGGFGGGGGGGW
ncbi:hypothetical protein GCM10022286_23350 [Gryllotalpicola daejeonensis]|uniref:DUF2207 domain-containing protein n=1 Tax=Gryllotalpicola daejeonensis TaxID=993087 RepID=A0ABP7ZLN5_9MICO